MKFKTLSSGKIIDDIIPYIKSYLKEWEETHYIEVIVGSDSQNRRRLTQFATVILLHKTSYESGIGKGGHVLYMMDTENRPYAVSEGERREHRKMRLLKEVQKSIFVAELLRENGIKVEHIDLDLNPDPLYKSNEVLTEAMGWVTGMGFHSRCKPEAISASYAADLVCK